AGGVDHRTGDRRRLSLGAADGGGPGRLDSGRPRLLVLRRALRLGALRGAEGLTPAGAGPAQTLKRTSARCSELRRRTAGVDQYVARADTGSRAGAQVFTSSTNFSLPPEGGYPWS